MMKKPGFIALRERGDGHYFFSLCLYCINLNEEINGGLKIAGFFLRLQYHSVIEVCGEQEGLNTLDSKLNLRNRESV